MKKARGIIFTFMFCVNIGLTIALLYLFVGRGYFVVGGFTSVEVVTIVLAALGVMLAALGFFIAMLAIWGYQSLHRVSEEVAIKTTENLVKSRLPALLRRELDDQLSMERVVDETEVPQAESADAVNSLDGGAK